MSGVAGNFPATANALGKIIQTTDGNYTETYTIPNTPGPYTHLLGANLTPTLPAGWQDVPLGAYPINPPGAVTLGSPAAYNTPAGFMTSGGVYKVAMTNVTDYGETIVGTITTFTLSAPNTAASYALPSVSQGTADAPIRKRRLYRSVSGGSSLFLVAEISDLSQLTYVDGLADVFLFTPPPSANGSGAIGAVQISGGGHSAGYWVEVAPGTGLVGGQYIVDYSTGLTGGTITHAAADANTLGVTAQFTAGTLASATVVNNIIQAVQDTAVAVIPLSQKGAASGVPALDSNNKIAGYYRHVGHQQNTVDVRGAYAANTWQTLQAQVNGNVNFSTLTASTRGGTLRFFLNGQVDSAFGTTGGLVLIHWRVNIDSGAAIVNLGKTEHLENQLSPPTALTAYYSGLTAASHTFWLEYMMEGDNTSQGFQILTASFPNSYVFTFTIDEF